MSWNLGSGTGGTGFDVVLNIGAYTGPGIFTSDKL